MTAASAVVAEVFPRPACQMYKFDPTGEPPETAFRAIALDQLDEALADLDRPAGEGRSVVHEARRRCKKLRALLRLMRPAFADFARENAALRDAAALLSHLRDAEVLEQTVAGLIDWRADPALDRLAQSLRDAPPMPDHPEKIAEFRARLAEVRVRAAHWSLHRTGVHAFAGGLRSNYRSTRRRMAKAGRGRDAADFHEWRKANKSYGFHLDLLKRSAPDLLGGDLAVVDRLSTLLGEHHDLTVLAAAIDQHRFPLETADGEAIGRLVGERRTGLEAEALDLGRQVLAERPRALARRFAAYWRSAA